MAYLKHNGSSNGSSKSKRPKQPKKTEQAAPAPVVKVDVDMSGIEVELAKVAHSLKSLNINACDGAMSLDVGLTTFNNGNPVQLTLSSNAYDDTLDRLVTAFERIADSVARLAGLSRPRLESWHEQDVYTPRYKDIAVDGGAPGPAEKS